MSNELAQSLIASETPETVYILGNSPSYTRTSHIYTAELVKRTPTGQTVVRLPSGTEKRFDKKNYELGKRYNGDCIISEEQYLERKQQNEAFRKRQDVRDQVEALPALFNKYSGSCDKETLVAELKKVLAAAEAL